jgi:SAM-dependent methyltransferase
MPNASATSPEPLFDRSLLRKRRARAVADARFPDFLHRAVADDLAERLSLMRRRFDAALLLGAAAPHVAERLGRSASIGSLILADEISAPARPLDLRLDAEALPFAPASLDAILAPLGLELANDLPGVLVQMRRALKPDGLLLATVLAGSTLSELRQAWIVAEGDITGGASPRVAPFADVRDLGGLLQRAGFALPVADADRLTVRYPDALALMRDLKAMGLANPLAARSRRPITRALLARAAAVYEEAFADGDGRVRATFELVTLTAWAPADSQPKPLRPGSAKARLADALGTVERKL